MSSRFGHYQLNSTQCQRLADTLGDTPETVISVHLLRRGLCQAHVAGSPTRFEGAIIQALHLPGEPTGFGENAAVLWALLQGIDGWDCVNVTPTCAPALGALIQTQLRTPVRYYGDIYHTLQQPVLLFDHPAVRQLTLKDLGLLEVAPPDVRGSGFSSTRTLLAEGIVAAAIIENRVVAIAHTSALSQQHTDIGISTLAGWREHGFASAAASIVAHQVQKAGLIPVWSTGENNYASFDIERSNSPNPL
jgi:GNAT acetyltransferase